MFRVGKRDYFIRWVAVRQAFSEFLFCLGFVLLPVLVATDMSVWLACGNLNRTDCVNFLALWHAQIDFPAGAGP